MATGGACQWMYDVSEAGRVAWRHLPSGPVRAAYEALDARLRATARTVREARSAVNYLYHFVCLFHDGGDAAADPRTLTGTAPDVARAAATWAEMQRRAAWGPTYRREVRTHLSRALLLVAPPLAAVVNPCMYRGACGGTRFRARRSQRADFTLHDCLPWRVRRLGPAGGPEYALLCRIGEAMSACLGSVSRAHLQSILVLFDHVLHDAPGLWPPGCADTVEQRWAYLSSLSGRAWLRRYADVFPNVGRGREDAAGDDDGDDGGGGAGRRPRRIGFDLLKRQIRYLSQFHGRVLHPDTRRYIPVPSGALRIAAGAASAARAWLADTSTSSSFGSSADDDHGGPSEEDAAVGDERRAMLDLLSELRQRCCREEAAEGEGGRGEEDAAAAPERVFAFAPDEVRRMVDGACTTQEQLMLMLMLTTGMRIGGVARLQLPAGAAPGTAEELVTTEKNRRGRRIHPTPCVRVLLARWYAHGRREARRATGPPTSASSPSAPSAFVFPSPVVPGAHVSTRHVWSVCRGLFERVGLSGRHVHPHTFRHTVVQMLFMNGSSFEAIAKWIGHASPATTSGVYGRLALGDAEAGLASTAPFLADDGGRGAAQRGEWESLARFLREPYHFTEATAAVAAAGTMRSRPPDPAAAAAAATSPRPSKQMRRALLARAAGATADVRTVEGTLQRQLELLVEVKQRLDAVHA